MTTKDEIAYLRNDLAHLVNRLQKLEGQESKETPFQVSMRKNNAGIKKFSFGWENHKHTWNDALRKAMKECPVPPAAQKWFCEHMEELLEP